MARSLLRAGAAEPHLLVVDSAKAVRHGLCPVALLALGVFHVVNAPLFFASSFLRRCAAARRRRRRADTDTVTACQVSPAAASGASAKAARKTRKRKSA